jgi:hypothetical protein
MVRVGGGAGRPADMAKSSEWRTDFGRFWLRRGTGFAGLDGCKDCDMPGTETGGSESKARGYPGLLVSNYTYSVMRNHLQSVMNLHSGTLNAIPCGAVHLPEQEFLRISRLTLIECAIHRALEFV